MNHHLIPTRARRILAATGAVGVLGAGLVLAAPLAASAHVVITPDGDATAGSSSVLTFAFSHGCDESPTTSISIDMPAGLDSVTPSIEPGWQVALTRANGDGLVQNVTYTAVDPIPTGLRATLDVAVKFSADAAGQTLVFPVVQGCVEGENDWTEVADAGQDPHELDEPAPTVLVAASASASGADADAAGDTAGVTGVWLGASGLVLGAAGLGAGLVALRRTRR